MMMDSSAVIEVSCGVGGGLPLMVTYAPAFVLWMILGEDKTDEELRGEGGICYTALSHQGVI